MFNFLRILSIIILSFDGMFYFSTYKNAKEVTLSDKKLYLLSYIYLFSSIMGILYIGKPVALYISIPLVVFSIHKFVGETIVSKFKEMNKVSYFLFTLISNVRLTLIVGLFVYTITK